MATKGNAEFKAQSNEFMHKTIVKTGRIITLFIFLINNTLLLYSQDFDLKNLASPSEYVARAIKSVNIPPSFRRIDKALEREEDKVFECFLENSALSYFFSCIAPLGYSSDGEFAVLMYGPSHKTAQDSIDFMKIRTVLDTLCMIKGAERPRKVASGPANFHRVTMNVHLNKMLQRDKAYEVTPEEFEKYFTFYPEEYARTKFNADSAATYYYWPTIETQPYQGKYIGSKALLLQKKDKGHLVLYCFYTEKSKYYIDDFMKEIEGIVWFKD